MHKSKQPPSVATMLPPDAGRLLSASGRVTTTESCALTHAGLGEASFVQFEKG